MKENTRYWLHEITAKAQTEYVYSMVVAQLTSLFRQVLLST